LLNHSDMDLILIDTWLAVSFSLMRKLFVSSLILITMVILTTANSYASDQENLIKGSDEAEMKHCKDFITAYIYDNHVIYTQTSGDYKGSNIYVFKTSDMSNDTCEVDFKNAEYTILVGEFGGANQFIGAYENIIFLDQWTGRNFKRLLGIDVESKSLAFLDTYTKPEIKGGALLYYRTLKAKRQSVRDKIPCPKAQEWKAEEKQVLYVEKMSVDLSTMKKEHSKEFLCIPSEPIESVKPKSYGH